MDSGRLKPIDWAWSDVKEEWVRLSEILKESPAPSKANAQGASLTLTLGWMCLLLGILTFHFSRVGLFFFLASFLLSAVAMAANRVNQGILLNIVTFVASEFALALLLS